MTIELLRQIIPAYKVIRQVGEGGSSLVYLAEERTGAEKMDSKQIGSGPAESARQIAVKVIEIPEDNADLDKAPYAQISPDYLDAYIREEAENCLKKVEMVRSMQASEHIIRIDQAEILPIPGERRLAVLIYMEYLDTLRHDLEAEKVHPEDFRVIGMDLCMALEACHNKKIIHRDIKIDNIFVRDGHYVLGDFGLSGYSEGTSSGDIMMGTRIYMAPEVYRSEENTARSDIYSLGMVLYILYNDSQIPFRPKDRRFVTAAEYDRAIMRRLNGEALPPPASSKYEVPQNITAIILKACSFDPADRFESATAMRAALEDPETFCRNLQRERDRKENERSKEESRQKKRRRTGIAALLLIAVPLLIAGMIRFGQWIDLMDRTRIAREHSELEGDMPPVTIRWKDAGLEDHPIECNDSYVEESLRRAAHKPEGQLMLSDVFEITMLRVDHFENIPGDEIGYRGAGDLSALSELINLKYLDVEYTTEDSLDKLAGLVNLEELDITASDSFRDISALRNMKQLQILHMPKCGLEDLSDLAELTELKELHIIDNSVSDLSPLKNLTGLEVLEIVDNPCKDISMLAGMDSMRELYLDGCPVEDYSVLSGLHKLKTFSVSETDFSDLSLLSGCRDLEYLDITFCPVADYTILSEFKKLEYLELYGTDFTDLTILENLDSLLSLNVGYTKVKDISPLIQLKSLRQLMLGFTEVEDFSPLQSMTDLEELFIYHTDFSDAALLKDMHQLSSLDLSYTKVTDISPLMDLENLQVLYIDELDLPQEQVDEINGILEQRMEEMEEMEF